MANKKGPAGPKKPPSKLMKNAAGATKAARDKQGRFVKLPESIKKPVNRNPIDNLPMNVGGRNQYGQFTKKDDFRKAADKQFPPNTTDAVEELVSPPKPPKERVPRVKKPKSTEPKDQTPFYDDPIFDLGHPEDSDIARRAQVEKLEGEKRVRRAMAQSVMRNIESKKIKKTKKLIVRQAANENSPPPTQEELRRLRDKHLERAKKPFKDNIGHDKGANDNRPEPTQEEIRAERDKHLENTKRTFRQKQKPMDPANDNSDGTEHPYSPSASARASSSSSSNAYSRFTMKGKKNYSRGGGGRGGPPGIFSGNVGPNGPRGNNSGMKILRGKVKFKKLKKDKEKSTSSTPDASLIASIGMLIMGAISGLYLAMQSMIHSAINGIIDGLNSIRTFFGFKPLPHIGGKKHPVPDSSQQNSITTTPIQKGSATVPPSQIGPTPQAPGTSATVTNPNGPSQSNNRVARTNPNIGPVAAPGADQYQKAFMEGGTQGAGGVTGRLISSGEGGYGSFNRGVAGDAGGRTIDFSQMTIREIMQKQNNRELFAVGKYQVIPSTMKGAIQRLNLDPNTKFAPAVQEQIYREYLIGVKRPEIKAYITGKTDNLNSAVHSTALEFASVATPGTGKSAYGDRGGNSASISAQQMARALQAERKEYEANIASGMNEQQAWSALSSGSGSSGDSEPTISKGPTGDPVDIHPQHQQQGDYNRPQMAPSRNNGGNPFDQRMSTTNQTGQPIIYRSQGSRMAVSPNANIFDLLASQAGNLRQGKMHPFALPGMNASGVNPMQLMADMSPGGQNGIMNVIQRLSNSPTAVQYRDNFPYSAGRVGQTGRVGNQSYLNPNVQNTYQQPGNENIIDSITGGITQSLTAVATTIMGGISKVGSMIGETNNQAGIGQMHIRDPRISTLDASSSFMQRDMIRPQG